MFLKNNLKIGKRINNCPACEKDNLIHRPAALSPFFEKIVFSKIRGYLINFSECPFCKYSFFNFKLSDRKLSNLYQDYRQEKYFQLRNKYEPWYSRRIHNDLHTGYKSAVKFKREFFIKKINELNIKNDFKNILDFGGYQGEMIKNISPGFNAKNRYLYDLVEVEPLKNITKIEQGQISNLNYDLIVNSQVLEHITNPNYFLQKLHNLGNKKTIYCFDVPYEINITNKYYLPNFLLNYFFQNIKRTSYIFRFFHFINALLKTLFKRRSLVCTEHLNFFSLSSLELMLKKNNFKILSINDVKEDSTIVAIVLKNE